MAETLRQRRARLKAERKRRTERVVELNTRVKKIDAWLRAHPLVPANPDLGQGIDVSVHQGDVDWGKVKASGVRWAYFKATEGRGFVDAKFERNLRNATAVGLRVGAYHFARPDSGGGSASDAVAECDDFVQAVRRQGRRFVAPRDWIAGKTGVLGVLDFETRPFSGLWARAWRDRFIEQTGVRPVVYAFGEPLNAIGPVVDEFGFVIVAAYVDDWKPFVNDGLEKYVRAWQFTSSGTCPGVKGMVDRNRWLK